jgi:hypothetical protein
VDSIYVGALENPLSETIMNRVKSPGEIALHSKIQKMPSGIKKRR